MTNAATGAAGKRAEIIASVINETTAGVKFKK